ncbi:class I SAM-dependent methyltransferase [Spirochaetota bacterium]
MKNKPWENHYKYNKSELSYPDENLVRLLSKYLNNFSDEFSSLNAVDLGCGSGRHLKLFHDLGIKNIIGTDNSFNALKISGKPGTYDLIHCDNKNIPLKNNSIDIVAAWGSLHYDYKDELPKMIEEILRILKTGGGLFATLRSDNDTYLKRGTLIGNNVWQTDLGDLEGSIASFYTDDEVQSYFSKFNDFSLGHMSRSIIGDKDKIISHWIIKAGK